MSEVLYRKYRPQRFAEVAGQDAVTRTLRNAIASGNVAHAYLFCGPRGTGKTTLGRLLAKAANCAAPEDGEPCEKCESCLAFNEGRAIDFIEQDAASHNSVEDIRQLRENVALTPMSGDRKVYLLDEVHMLSSAAQNALLKTLEEPPPHIIFVLATTEAHKVSTTIISRCQRFDLRRIPMPDAVERLAYVAKGEGFEIDRGSLEEIARAATGSLRDAINALEQVVSYYGKSPTPEQVREALGLSVDVRSGQLARQAMAGDLGGALRTIAAVRDEGADMKEFSRHVVRYLRGLLLAKAGAAEALELPAELAAEVKAEAVKLSHDEIVRALQSFGRIDWRDDKAAAGGSLPLELALVEYISDGEKPERAAAPPPPPPPPAKAPPPKPKPEPRYSIPAAEMDGGRDERGSSDGAIGASGAGAGTGARSCARGANRSPRVSRRAGSEGASDGRAAGPGAAGAAAERGGQDAGCSAERVVRGEVGGGGGGGAGVLPHVPPGTDRKRAVQGSPGGGVLGGAGPAVTVTYEHSPREQAAGGEPRRAGTWRRPRGELGARAVPRDE